MEGDAYEDFLEKEGLAEVIWKGMPVGTSLINKVWQKERGRGCVRGLPC